MLRVLRQDLGGINTARRSQEVSLIALIFSPLAEDERGSSMVIIYFKHAERENDIRVLTVRHVKMLHIIQTIGTF